MFWFISNGTAKMMLAILAFLNFSKNALNEDVNRGTTEIHNAFTF